MNAIILAGLSKSEREQLNLPPNILKLIEREETDKSYYNPNALHADAWWLYVEANRRAQIAEQGKKDLSRFTNAVLAENARLLAELAAFRAQFLSDKTIGGVK